MGQTIPKWNDANYRIYGSYGKQPFATQLIAASIIYNVLSHSYFDSRNGPSNPNSYSKQHSSNAHAYQGHHLQLMQ